MTIVLRQQREQESETEGESYRIPGPPEVDIGGRAGTARPPGEDGRYAQRNIAGSRRHGKKT